MELVGVICVKQKIISRRGEGIRYKPAEEVDGRF